MKKFLAFIFLSGVICFGFLAAYSPSFQTGLAEIFYPSVCDRPVSYSIGTVDNKFNISRGDFLNDTRLAASVWNVASGKPLILYNQSSAMTVSLVFDRRQLLDNQISNLENTLQNQKQSIDPEIARYRQLDSDFKQKVEALNNEIAYWNGKGGAPPDEYNLLMQQKQNLEKEASDLKAIAENLNQKTSQFNVQVDTLNQTVTDFNKELALKPEEGVFDSKNDTIEIYFDNNSSELIHTLAHEMGHAIGLGHNGNPASIMYPFTTRYLTPTSDDLKALQTLCQRHFILSLLKDRILYLYNRDKNNPAK